MRLRAPLLLAFVALVVGLSPSAATAQPLEAAVKAAFLPKFAPYATWPVFAEPSPGAPYVICVVGRDPFGALVDEAAVGARRDASPIAIRRVGKIDRHSGCHIAYLGGSTVQPVGTALAALADAPVLTVTDAGVGRDRGMVHFELKGGRVRFHIDDVAAARAQLTLSSKLMNLALSVRQRPRP